MNIISTYPVIIIGAGQAGIAVSYYLKQSNIKHVVLEKSAIAASWKTQRWDSFSMNTPNWMTTLPGMDAAGNKHGFMTGTDFSTYLETYATTFSLPIHEGCEVVSVNRKGKGYELITKSKQEEAKWYASHVVIASGMINVPKLPGLSSQLPFTVNQLHAANYKNPGQLKDGGVLIVGAGQTGCQLAEELALAGKNVYLAGSRVPRVPRRYKGKDIMEWQQITGAMDVPAEMLKANAGLNAMQPQVSGKGVLGHTVSYQSLHSMGVTVLGTFTGFENEKFTFTDNSAVFIQFADRASEAIKQKVAAFTALHPEILTKDEDVDVADITDENLDSASGITEIKAGIEGITTVIWATGFGYDFNYLDTSLLDEKQRPMHVNGIMAGTGLYCIGFPWLRTKKSGLVYGVADDAAFVCGNIIEALQEKAIAEKQ